MIIKKFKGIVKLWLELTITLSESKVACGTLDSGLETALRTWKSSLQVLDMGLGDVEENVNGELYKSEYKHLRFWKLFCRFSILINFKFIE